MKQLAVQKKLNIAIGQKRNITSVSDWKLCR